MMTVVRRAALTLLVIAATGLGLVPSSPRTGAAQGQNGARPEVRYATRTDTSAPLRHLPERPPLPAVIGEIFQRPRKLLPNRMGSIPLSRRVAPLVRRRSRTPALVESATSMGSCRPTSPAPSA